MYQLRLGTAGLFCLKSINLGVFPQIVPSMVPVKLKLAWHCLNIISLYFIIRANADRERINEFPEAMISCSGMNRNLSSSQHSSAPLSCLFCVGNWRKEIRKGPRKGRNGNIKKTVEEFPLLLVRWGCMKGCALLKEGWRGKLKLFKTNKRERLLIEGSGRGSARNEGLRCLTLFLVLMRPLSLLRRLSPFEEG